jgi:hypothetical protein
MSASARLFQPAASLCLAAGLALPAAATGTGPAPDPVQRFVAETFGVEAGDFARVRSGQIVARTLPAKDSREVATFGIARVKITPEFFVSQLANITSFKRDEAVLQIGVFGHPPDVRDLGALTLDEPDLKSLRSCRVSDCGVQLPAAAIDRFRQQVDWRRADAPEQANAVLRQVLVSYVGAYQQQGAAAPLQYADHSKVTDMPREFVSLTEAIPLLGQRFPAFRQHLLRYPAPLIGATDVVYWSKEKMGRKAVISVTHLAIAPVGGQSPVDYVAASKHLFGTHYLDASLSFTVLLRDRSDPAPALYLIYMNRSRVDVFGGMFGGMIRKIVTSRARGAVSDQLGRLRRRLETGFAAVPVS